MKTLRDKRVMITGAARGLGKSMAQAFAERGAELVLADIQEEPLEETRRELTEAGARCHAYRLDVTDPEGILELRDTIHRQAGRLDVLVNNAGVVFGGSFLDVPLERHRTTYRVNIEGMVAMTHAFLPDLLDAPEGHLVFIASASGFVGLPNGATYASSKWATIGFSESIRQELKVLDQDRVGVTTVCPTYINTGMFEGVEPPKTTHMLDPDEIAAKVVKAVERRWVWVLEPWIVKITPFLQGVLPTALSDRLADLFGASSSMQSWKGHAD